MTVETTIVAFQATVADQILLTLLQGLVVVGFLGVSILVTHLLVQAVQTENDGLRVRDATVVLAGAGVLFSIGFTRLVTVDNTPREGLAGIALGFAGVTYLLYTARPELFELSEQDETTTVAEDPPD
jgi:hypothetical protein